MAKRTVIQQNRKATTPRHGGLGGYVNRSHQHPLKNWMNHSRVWDVVTTQQQNLHAATTPPAPVCNCKPETPALPESHSSLSCWPSHTLFSISLWPMGLLKYNFEMVSFGHFLSRLMRERLQSNLVLPVRHLLHIMGWSRHLCGKVVSPLGGKALLGWGHSPAPLLVPLLSACGCNVSVAMCLHHHKGLHSFLTCDPE